MPKRIQRKRTKGWKMPENTVYAGRGSKYGNPFKVGFFKGYGKQDAIKDFRKWILREPDMRSAESCFTHGKPPTIEEIKSELKGKNLACWCKEGEPCHADVLLEIANN